jgi:hypothetical protein
MSCMTFFVHVLMQVRMRLRSLFGMILRMQVMGMCYVCMMRSFCMIAFFNVLGGFPVMMSGLLGMMGSIVMMLCVLS